MLRQEYNQIVPIPWIQYVPQRRRSDGVSTQGRWEFIFDGRVGVKVRDVLEGRFKGLHGEHDACIEPISKLRWFVHVISRCFSITIYHAYYLCPGTRSSSLYSTEKCETHSRWARNTHYTRNTPQESSRSYTNIFS